VAHYLVTGGGGFIGSHLVERLLVEGHRVRVLDDFSTGRRSNIEAVRKAGADRLQVSTSDVRDDAAVGRAVGGVDGVFHLAALGSVPRSMAHPLETHAVNATGTLNVLAAATEAKVPRLVFAGSSSVYGALEEIPKREDHPTRPISPYGLTKLIGEEYLALFREVFGLQTVALRYYNVFGPRQNPNSQYAAVIPSFVRKILRGESPVIYGNGEQSRDFTYVANVVDATLLAMEAPAERVAPGLFNVAVGGRISLNQLVRTLGEIVGREVVPTYTDPRPGDILHSQADISRARERLGFEPRVSFEEGLALTVEYFREKGDAA
jgi:UDP-N-acetylglucosamine/UDP-N-acetyl-alpha-D-glucosaminouronate 4-epimerase